MARDFTGMTFGKLRVVGQIGLRSFGRGKAFYVRCTCVCGATIEIQQSNLLKRKDPSCGCERPTIATSGKGGNKHPLYKAWRAMVERCTNPANKSFRDYGERGITVCPRWTAGDEGVSGFECFAQDIGPKPTPAHMLERKNNDEGYSPENCMWADRQTQNSNKRSNIIVTVGRQSLTVAEWSRRLGRSEFLIYRRIYRGWDPVLAVTTPPRTASKKRFRS